MNLSKEKSVNYNLVLIGVLLFIGVLVFVDIENEFEMVATVGITVLIAFWWLTEAIPIGITSLLPVVLFPVFGVLSGKEVSEAYINYIIFLFIGGFIMALSIQKWNLHKRMALKILSKVGTSFFQVLFGCMLCASFLSMWISNTASAMMMIPIVLSISNVLNENFGKKAMKKYTTSLILSIAYACSIGGVATFVGTPPNLSFLRISGILYPEFPEISFGEWLFAAFPVSVCMLLCGAVFLYLKGKPRNINADALSKDYFKKEYFKLGKTTSEQKRVLFVFALMVFLWLFRKELTIGDFVIPGWSNLFAKPNYINDGTVAIFIAFLLFLIPSSKKGKALVSWKVTKQIPWHVVFLLGGGFAIAKAFVSSGLSVFVGNQLLGLQGVSAYKLTALAVGTITVLTEFTKNPATTEIMLPIIATVSSAIKIHPLLLMMPVTFAASMAFMLPVATAPNALVFATGKVSILEMIKIGSVLNLIAIILIVIVSVFWLPYVFDIGPLDFPEWAVIQGDSN